MKYMLSRNWIFILFFLLSKCLSAQNKIVIPDVILSDISTEIQLNDLDETKNNYLLVGEERIDIHSEDGKAIVSHTFDHEITIELYSDAILLEKLNANPIPLWLSLIPPLIAILLALLFKEVVSSLLIGIFIGAFILHFYSDGLVQGLLFAFMATIDRFILSALNDEGHLSIIVFSLLIGGMVSIVSRNGGMQGIVNRISKYATDARSGQLATWGLGIAIFFDDYANTLIVGNTMRPITDRLKISREKLAYIVDSTAAPMAAIALITTWIGAELGYIESGIAQIKGYDSGVYATFISSLAYSFYPILALFFMFILIYKKRDFGPMLHAENKARKANSADSKLEGDEKMSSELQEFLPIENSGDKAFNAVIPVLTVIFGTIAGLIYSGWDGEVINDESIGFFKKLSIVIGNSDSYKALLWASFAGAIVAIKLSILGKILSLQQAIQALINGFKTMLPAIIILVLAWSLAAVIEELHTADFLTSLLSDSLSPYLLPSITFLLAAMVAFSTGSSWGTMAILYPIMLPAAWSICMANGVEEALSISIFHNTIACVLAGAVLGDHCSPISDTTILSSLASSCNHISHVKTQMPYALTVGLVATLLGTLPSGFGVPTWVCFSLAFIALFLIVHFFGKKTA